MLTSSRKLFENVKNTPQDVVVSLDNRLGRVCSLTRCYPVLILCARVEYDLLLQSNYEKIPRGYPDKLLGRHLGDIELAMRPNMMTTAEDMFQAKIMQGVAALWTGHVRPVTTLIGDNIDAEFVEIRKQSSHQRSTFVCLVKGAYARGKNRPARPSNRSLIANRRGLDPNGYHPCAEVV